jgi:hypothetical protein
LHPDPVEASTSVKLKLISPTVPGRANLKASVGNNVFKYAAEALKRAVYVRDLASIGCVGWPSEGTTTGPNDIGEDQ